MLLLARLYQTSKAQEPLSKPAEALKNDRPAKTERKPLNAGECAQLFDEDGRLVKEAKLREALFEG